MPEELHKRLKIKAAIGETSMTEIIVETLEMYVK